MRRPLAYLALALLGAAVSAPATAKDEDSSANTQSTPMGTKPKRADSAEKSGYAPIPVAGHTDTKSKQVGSAKKQPLEKDGDAVGSRTFGVDSAAKQPAQDEAADIEPLAPIETKNRIQVNADVSLPQDI